MKSINRQVFKLLGCLKNKFLYEFYCKFNMHWETRKQEKYLNLKC